MKKETGLGREGGKGSSFGIDGMRGVFFGRIGERGLEWDGYEGGGGGRRESVVRVW